MSIQENVVSFDPQRAVVRADRPIGAILMEEGKLTAKEVERVLQVAEKHAIRFGEAAVRLGLVTDSDVRFALSKQYDFPHLLPARPEDKSAPSTELVAAFAPFHPRSEEIRALRTQLLIRWFKRDVGHNALVVASPQPGEGRSYVAANLAVAFSQLGARTLLVDADMRKPRQHRIFGLPQGQGLSSLLSGRADQTATFPIPGLNRLSVLPAGPLPPNAQELLSRLTFTTLVKDMQSLYDVVIIDTPPAQRYADAQAVAYRAGSAIVVARKDHTSVNATSRVVHDLAGTGARVVGTVINSY
ncbi:MAG: chain length determinant protein tyrosine kinase EpsG [Bacillota bacterium]